MPGNTLLKKCKGLLAFFVKTLVLWLSRSEALLVGRRNDKIQRMSKREKGRKKGKIFQCGVLRVQIIGPSVARPQRRSSL